MTSTFIMQTTFEILLIMAVIVILRYEPFIAEWEQKVLKKMKRKKVNK